MNVCPDRKSKVPSALEETKGVEETDTGVQILY